MKKFWLILFSLFFLAFSACNSENHKISNGETATIVFYGIFDNEEVFAPIIENFESKNPEVKVIYKKFNDPEKYLDQIINEIAEGEGPDIFMLHNSWFPKHYKKLYPVPEEILTVDSFSDQYAKVAVDDLVFPDQEGIERIWGIPIYIDTLALYFNKNHFE